MAGSDKILEAEQTIQNIAAELTRMRDAASLLQGAQERSEAVLTSSQRLMQEVEKFSRACGDLVTKLEEFDFNRFNRFFESLRTEMTQIGITVKGYGENTTNAISDVESRLAGIEAKSKDSLTRQTLTLVFAIAAFGAAAGTIVVMLLLGG